MSRHLVLPVRRPIALRDLLDQVEDAHRFLVEAARATIPRLASLPKDGWATAAKREPVVLSDNARPHLVSKSVKTHSFVEVMNQCATLERLIDALAWVETVADLKDAKAITCNPTTSSAPRKKGVPRDDQDHDLVLEDGGGTRWKFEVSDVAGEKGFAKEKKDLLSLGVPTNDADTWPKGRSFLVVSSEFADRLRRPTRHGLRLGLFHYAELKPTGATRIFEVRRGQAPEQNPK